MTFSLLRKPGHIQIMHCFGGGGSAGGNAGDAAGRDASSRSGGYTSIGDMFDGGGPGQSGDTFGGALGGVSNAIGATPKGSDREATGLAGFFSKATGVGNDGNIDPAKAALMGILTGGLTGAIAGAAGAVAKNSVANNGGLKGLIGGQANSTAHISGPMTSSPRPEARPTAAVAPSRGNYENPKTAPAYTTTDTSKPETDNAASTEPLSMTAESARGAYAPIPNPAYNPADPMSPRFISNPSYAQLLAYRNYQLDPTGEAPVFANAGTQLRTGMNYNPVQMVGTYSPAPTVRLMAKGGEVQANEKSVISDAVSAVKGALPEQDAALALGIFVKKYGRDALRDLVDRVRSGELDDTTARSEGALRGPGDGMNDRIPASIEGGGDVLLSDGEFVVPADVVSGLGNGSSAAGSKELERFMARVREERTGKSAQPDAIDPASMLPV